MLIPPLVTLPAPTIDGSIASSSLSGSFSEDGRSAEAPDPIDVTFEALLEDAPTAALARPVASNDPQSEPTPRLRIDFAARPLVAGRTAPTIAIGEGVILGPQEGLFVREEKVQEEIGDVDRLQSSDVVVSPFRMDVSAPSLTPVSRVSATASGAIAGADVKPGSGRSSEAGHHGNSRGEAIIQSAELAGAPQSVERAFAEAAAPVSEGDISRVETPAPASPPGASELLTIDTPPVRDHNSKPPIEARPAETPPTDHGVSAVADAIARRIAAIESPAPVGRMLRHADGRIELRLDPPDLGRVVIDFQTGEGDTIKVVGVAETRDGLQALRQIVDLVSRDLTRDSGALAFEFRQGARGGDQRQPRRGIDVEASELRVAEGAPKAQKRGAGGGHSIDVRI